MKIRLTPIVFALGGLGGLVFGTTLPQVQAAPPPTTTAKTAVPTVDAAMAVRLSVLEKRIESLEAEVKRLQAEREMPQNVSAPIYTVPGGGARGGFGGGIGSYGPAQPLSRPMPVQSWLIQAPATPR